MYQINKIRTNQPELPRQTALRLMELGLNSDQLFQLIFFVGLSLGDSTTLVEEPGAVAYFDACVASYRAGAVQVASWIVSDLFAILKYVCPTKLC